MNATRLTVIVSLVFCLSLQAQEQAAPAATRIVVIKAVHGESGAPIAGVHVWSLLDGEQPKTAETDDAGEARIALPGAAEGLSISYRKDQFQRPDGGSSRRMFGGRTS